MGDKPITGVLPSPEVDTGAIFAYPQPPEALTFGLEYQISEIDHRLNEIEKGHQTAVSMLEDLGRQRAQAIQMRNELIDALQRNRLEQTRLQDEAAAKAKAKEEANRESQKIEAVARIKDLLGRVAAIGADPRRTLALLSDDVRSVMIPFLEAYFSDAKNPTEKDPSDVTPLVDGCQEETTEEAAGGSFTEMSSCGLLSGVAADRSGQVVASWPAPKIALPAPTIDTLKFVSETPILPPVIDIEPIVPPFTLPLWEPPVFLEVPEPAVSVVPVLPSELTHNTPKLEQRKHGGFGSRALRFLGGTALFFGASIAAFGLSSFASSEMSSSSDAPVENTTLPTTQTIVVPVSSPETTIASTVAPTVQTAAETSTTSTIMPAETTLPPSSIARLKAGEINLKDLYGQPDLYTISAPTICLDAPVYGSNSSATKTDRVYDPLYFVIPDATPQTACDTWQGESEYTPRWAAPVKGSENAKSYGNTAALTPMYVVRTDSKGILGEYGTVVFETHRTTEGAGGMNLDALRVGDEITITGNDGVIYTFVKGSSETIDPVHFNEEVLNYTDPSGTPALVISTCDDNGQVRFVTYFTLKGA